MMGLLGGCGVPTPPGMKPLPNSASIALCVEGVGRSYLLHTPTGWNRREPKPLLIALHGAFASPALFEHQSRFSTLADREGFIVAYPAGRDLFGRLRHWNAVHGVGMAYMADWHDSLFVRRVIEDVCGRLPVDATRIFLVGHSNGAMLVHRLVGELDLPIAAAASVAGTAGGRPYPWCDVRLPARPNRPIPFVMVHGDQDRIVPFRGGRPENRLLSRRVDLSFAESVEHWRQRSEATLVDTTVIAGERVIRYEYRGTTHRAHLLAYVVRDWGHAWPGPGGNRHDGKASLANWDATEAIWRFFQEHAADAPAQASSPMP